MLIKSIAFLFLGGCVLFSCKNKEELGKVGFSTTFSKVEDMDAYDSVTQLVIKYSLSTELKSTDVKDSTDYLHEIKLAVDKSEIQKVNYHYKTELQKFESGQYVIKGFDLVDSSGKTIYYIPYDVPEKYRNVTANSVLTLPLTFHPSESDVTFDYIVIKK
jgi:hypothetical protein